MRYRLQGWLRTVKRIDLILCLSILLLTGEGDGLAHRALAAALHRHRLRVVGLGVEGRPAHRHPVVLDEHNVEADGVGDELGDEAVLDVAGHLDGDVLHGALDGHGQLGVGPLRHLDGELAGHVDGDEAEVFQLHLDLGEAAAAAAVAEVVGVSDTAEEGRAGDLTVNNGNNTVTLQQSGTDLVVVEHDLYLMGDGLLGGVGYQALAATQHLDSVGDVAVVDRNLQLTFAGF